jgi:hypothetical protein
MTARGRKGKMRHYRGLVSLAYDSCVVDAYIWTVIAPNETVTLYSR